MAKTKVERQRIMEQEIAALYDRLLRQAKPSSTIREVEMTHTTFVMIRW